jgi:XrtJ-associated TM-motif-TM protein
MKLKKMLLALSFAATLFAALPLHAQTGCDDSPEDPTIFLALIGGAGGIASALFRLRRNK